MKERVLPSWNAGPVKAAIVDFVAQVTEEGGPDYVPPAERIATFDNDGTLWCEQPLQIQVMFAQARLAELAVQYPVLAERQPFKAFLENDLEAIHDYGRQGVLEVAFELLAGITVDEFQDIARAWFATARHRGLGRPYARCLYQPQIELLDYLSDNGFRTFIVSGGGIDFIRAIAEEAYGIPPERVIGSSLKLRPEFREGRLGLIKQSELNCFNDREAKVQNICLHIGRRPILAFGNSDGDIAMLRYCATGERPGLALLLHHDDRVREFAYDREFRLSPLSEALDKAKAYGITLVSMKEDWRRVFVREEMAAEPKNIARVRA
jgi:phosphoserine phosphatase